MPGLRRTGWADAARRRSLALVVVTVVVSDQLSKWWAWRHYDETLINTGGYILLGTTIRGWYAAPVSGLVLDLLGLVVLALAGWYLVRRPSSVGVTAAGAVLAGLTSNLVDRMGLHSVNAPGSERGVVDFLVSPDGGRANIADVWIVLGLLTLLAVEIHRRTGAGGRRPTFLRGSGTMRSCLPPPGPPNLRRSSPPAPRRPSGVRRST